MIGNVRRKPGRDGWEWRGVIVDELGRRKRLSAYAATRDEALEKAAQLIARAKVGEPIRDDRRKVGEWLRHWSEVILPATTRAANTRSQYQSLIRTHLAPALDAVQLAELRPSTIALVLAELERKGLAASTRRSAYAALRAALDDAVRDRLIARNPAVEVKRPKADPLRPRIVDPTRVRQLLDAARGHRYFPALAVAVECGLRRGEVLGLEWDDLDLDGLELEVSGTLTRADGKLEKGSPKSITSRRRVPISSGLAAELRRVRAEWLEHRMMLGPSWGESPRGGYVFTSRAGTPVEPRSFSRWYAELCRELGIEETGVHSMRHAAATGWIADGTDPRTVAELLGHADGGALALKLYASSDDERRRRAVEDRSRALGLG